MLTESSLIHLAINGRVIGIAVLPCLLLIEILSDVTCVGRRTVFMCLSHVAWQGR